LRAEGIDAVGPLPADTLFHERARATYDVALCMYHDQALIPIKTLAFDHAVNVTLGLPFVRTSPDHGTAFDIAGRGIADPSSLRAAVRMARCLSEPACFVSWRDGVFRLASCLRARWVARSIRYALSTARMRPVSHMRASIRDVIEIVS